MDSSRVFDVAPASDYEWFLALDGRRVESRGRSWVTEVCGVHTDGSDWWIQIAPTDAPERGVVLHLARSATVLGALAALHEHASAESLPNQVVHVTRAA